MKRLALAVLLGSASMYLIGSCRRSIPGLDPTTGRSIVIRDFANCGPSCKFRVNRDRVAGAARGCLLRRSAGYLLAATALLLLALVLSSAHR